MSSLTEWQIQRIRVSLGMRVYTRRWTFTQLTGADISAATFTLALVPVGVEPASGDWLAPQLTQAGTITKGDYADLHPDAVIDRAIPDSQPLYWISGCLLVGPAPLDGFVAGDEAELWRDVVNDPEVLPDLAGLRCIFR